MATARKNFSRSIKAIKKVSQKYRNATELTEIEEILGEEFETIGEARRALARDVKKATPDFPPAKRSYSIRDLKLPRDTNYYEFMRTLDSHIDELEASRKPDEQFALSMETPEGLKRTYLIKSNAYSLADWFRGSASGVAWKSAPRKVQEGIVDAIRIVKLPIRDTEKYFNQYSKQKVKGRKEFKRRVTEEARPVIEKEVREKVAAEQKGFLKSIGRTVSALQKANSELAKENAAIKKQLAKLSKPAKRQAKKVVKQIRKAPKKTKVVKRATKKPTPKKRVSSKRSTVAPKHAKRESKKPQNKKGTPAKKATKKVSSKRTAKKSSSKNATKKRRRV